jgi:hypothetical protein
MYALRSLACKPARVETTQSAGEALFLVCLEGACSRLNELVGHAVDLGHASHQADRSLRARACHCPIVLRGDPSGSRWGVKPQLATRSRAQSTAVRRSGTTPSSSGGTSAASYIGSYPFTR